jgi:hypothetical protein
MTRLLLIAVLGAVAGCGDDKKTDAKHDSPDASIFDKKEMPKDGRKKGAQATKGAQGQ